MLSITTFALVSALAVSAADIQVNVGASNELIFDPSQVTAQPGDNIHFQFQSKNHSVTQSTFATPCTRLANGIDSGFMAVNATATTQPVWTFQVTNSTPLWFFCAQTVPIVHCASGMVFAVNPTADKTFQQFQAAANGTSAGSVIPAPSTLPTGSGTTGSGAAAPPAQSGFSTVAGAPAATGTGAGAGTNTGTGTAAAASPSNSSSSAVGLNSASAFSLVAVFAAVAGLML